MLIHRRGAGLGGPQVVGGNVLVDAVGPSGTNEPRHNGATSPWTPASFITLAADANALVVGFYNARASPATGLALTWDSGGSSQTMTQIATQAVNASLNLYLFGLLNPVTGSGKTLTVSWSGGDANQEFQLDAISFSGVNGTFASAFPNQASGTGIATVNVTSATNHKVVAIMEVGGGGPSGVTGTTIFLDGVNGNIGNGAMNWDNGSASVIIGNALAGGVLATDVSF